MRAHVEVQSLEDVHLVKWAAARNELWPVNNIESHKSEIIELLGSTSFVAWGAWLDSKLVGFAEVFVRPFVNGCESRPVPFLEGIWVRTDIRGNGVSKLLISAVENWARENGFKELGSDADIENSVSQQTHERWGFKETERVIYYRKDITK